MKKPTIDYDWNDSGSWLIVEKQNGDGLSTKDIMGAYENMIDALIEVHKAYQGVGDFEGTGENMSKIIGNVRKVLIDAGCTEGEDDNN